MSQISPLMFFSSEKELFSSTYLLKKTPRGTKILISPIWNKIKKSETYFLSSYKQKYNAAKIISKSLLPEETGAFGNNIEKEAQKPQQKLKKYVYYKYLQRTSALPALQCKW